MSKQRIINTRFWEDSYINKLDPSEKLLFLYLLTNPVTDICGVYEIPLRRMAFDTGFDSEMIETIMKRFERDKKVVYRDEWVAVVNFTKHQNTNPNVEKGINRCFNQAPSHIIEALQSLRKPLQESPKPNLTKPNLSERKSKDFHTSLEEGEITEVKGNIEYDDDPQVSPRKNVTPETKEINQHFRQLSEKHLGIKSPLSLGKQGAIIKKALKTLSKAEIYDLFDWWFEEHHEGKTDADLAQITQALSDYNITRYQTQHD